MKIRAREINSTKRIRNTAKTNAYVRKQNYRKKGCGCGGGK